MVRVKDAVDLSFASVQRLKADAWLDMWLIAAALELTDRPSCMKYGLCMPLDQPVPPSREEVSAERKAKRKAKRKDVLLDHEIVILEDKSGPPHDGSLPEDLEKEFIPVVNPFGRWRKEIDAHRSSSGDGARQVYFCPLNQSMNHFTLLEINEHSRMIYHYDSMAKGNFRRGAGSSRVKRLVQVGNADPAPGRIRADPMQAEFKDLGFGYEEAVSNRSQGATVMLTCSLALSPAEGHFVVWFDGDTERKGADERT